MAASSGVVSVAAQSGLVYRDLTSADVHGVKSLLAVVPQLYPGGDQWMDRRLKDAIAGRARCTLALRDDVLAGVAIETPKAGQRIKLSTFLIDSAHRHLGIGADLVGHLRDRWIDEEVTEAYVTVADNVMSSVHGTFRKGGFTPTALEQNRYGDGRHEHVMIWLPSKRG